MANPETFDIPPIRQIVKRYLRESKLSLDPFARNKRWATYTNDLNPDTKAQYHVKAIDFLKFMEDSAVEPDLVLFDPPYSPAQVKEVYQGIGLEVGQEDVWMTAAWTSERDIIHRILQVGGVVVSLGWNSSGMGKKRGYEFLEGLIVNHGAAHSDTIVVVERKLAHQERLL